MKIDDIMKLDWKRDKDLLAVQQKLTGLTDRETQDRTRLTELDQIIQDAERSLVQAMAAELLNETADEPAEEIQERLNAARREIVDLHTNSQALKLAQQRLEPALEAAKSEARLRVASTLAPLYQKTTEALRELLAKAAEVNQLLHVIHTQALKCELRRETHAHPGLKPLGFPMALNVLGLAGGKPSPELKLWHDHVDRLFDTN